MALGTAPLVGTASVYTEGTAALGGDAGSLEFSSSCSIVESDIFLGGRTRPVWLDSIFIPEQKTQMVEVTNMTEAHHS